MHSFRECLSEIGIVVLGIVIALGGEQWVEHLRDTQKATEARAGIRDEIAMNIAVLLSRSSNQSCIDRRIDDVARLLEGSDAPNYVAPSWLGRPQIWEMLHARWQVVAQAGRAPLLAPEEQAGYGFVYALFADIGADEDREQLAWARMRAIEGLPHPSSAMKDEVRLALQEARLNNWDIKGLSKLVQSKATEMAVAEGSAIPRQQVDTGICLPTSTPRAEALNRLSTEKGQPVDQP